MSDFDNTNRGVLFKNDKEGIDNRPDYKGSMDVNGVDHWLSCWLKTSKGGKKYMSLSVQPKDDVHSKGMEQAQQAVNQGNDPVDYELDQSIPF